MMINAEKKNTDGAVEFISYSGGWPNLCTGTLVVKIDGEKVTFGFDEEYNRFWRSGGSCGFIGGYSESYCDSGEWVIDVEALPEKYKKYASELDKVFNANVPQGCCGGCL